MADLTKFQQEVHDHIMAGYQAIWVETPEESRAIEELEAVAQRIGMELVTWSLALGFDSPELAGPKYRSPLEAIAAVISGAESALFVFRDLDDVLHDPTVRRLLRDAIVRQQLVTYERKRPIVIVSPNGQVHEKLQTDIPLVEFKRPTKPELAKMVDGLIESIEEQQGRKIEVDPELHAAIVNKLRGLTAKEAEDVLALCLVRHHGFCPEMLQTIQNEKAATIRKSGVLRYIEPERIRSTEHVVGYDGYLQWLRRRARAFSREGREANLDLPRGCVLLGVPGTGKSMVAKTTCQELDMPGYIMDVSAVFSSLVGESERKMRTALRQIEAQQGCVLVIDEADKLLGGASRATGDSGVTRRIFGQLLTWLAEQQAEAFTIITVNDVSGFPPEFLRAGRFDAVFYTDLPTAEERRRILEVHFRLRGVEPKFTANEWKRLVSATHGFVGSELEEVVKEARYIAFEDRKDAVPTLDETLAAVKSIVPMVKRDPDGIAKIREFCQNRARPVGAGESREKSSSRSVELN